MKERRKISTVFDDFVSTIEALLRLDRRNQDQYQSGPGRPSSERLSTSQMSLLTEGIFMRAFSSYERFVEDVFVLYTRGKKTRSGVSVRSFLTPRSNSHARDMLQSNRNFLDWNDPDLVIQRAETYLSTGGPIKTALATHRSSLQIMRRIRNASAHQSGQALLSYANAVQTELRAPPLKLPPPGEFLLMNDPRRPHPYFLISYLTVLRTVADIATA